MSILKLMLFAYIDPGAGSYLLQLILAGLFAASFALKLFWGKIRAFFSRLFEKCKKQK